LPLGAAVSLSSETVYTVLQAQPSALLLNWGLSVVGDFLIADVKEDRKCVTFCLEVDKNVSEPEEIVSKQLSVTMPWEEHKPSEWFSQSRRVELSVAHCEHSRRPFTGRDRRNVEKGQNTSTKTD